jgi:excisionase family DNA binding protein
MLAPLRRGDQRPAPPTRTAPRVEFRSRYELAADRHGARWSTRSDSVRRMPEPQEFLTVAEVAGILKLNQQTVRNWIDAGKLPAVHVGRRVRIKRSDSTG